MYFKKILGSSLKRRTVRDSRSRKTRIPTERWTMTRRRRTGITEKRMGELGTSTKRMRCLCSLMVNWKYRERPAGIWI